MLCALLACVGWLYPQLAGDTVAVSPHHQAMLVLGDAAPTHTVAGQGADDEAPSAPAHTLEWAMGDFAGDLPELLLLTPRPVAPAAHVDRYVQQSLHELPHPFLEKPQRPPRAAVLHA